MLMAYFDEWLRDGDMLKSNVRESGRMTGSENWIFASSFSVLSEVVDDEVILNVKLGDLDSMHISGLVEDPPVQTYSFSIYHCDEHPSPLSKFPSSHAFDPILNPSPHISLQYLTCTEREEFSRG